MFAEQLRPVKLSSTPEDGLDAESQTAELQKYGLLEDVIDEVLDLHFTFQDFWVVFQDRERLGISRNARS